MLSGLGLEIFAASKTFSPTTPPPNPKMPKIIEIFYSVLFVLSFHISVPVNFVLTRGHAIFQGGHTKYSTLIYKSTLADCRFRQCRVS